MPRHVAIIMDGNGRWARQRDLARNEGHKAGVQNVREIVRSAHELNLRYLTLYAFSVENWKRPRHEVEALMFLLERYLSEQGKELMEKQIRLRALGRIDDLPAKVAKLLRHWMSATAHFSEWNLSLALNYGSRSEVVDAVRSCLEACNRGELNAESLDWTSFSRHLYTHDLPDPDLVIRTSGEYRISNFLLLQSAYAEYYFSAKYWPDFDKEDFTQALREYARRERRFGHTGDQIKQQPVTCLT